MGVYLKMFFEQLSVGIAITDLTNGLDAVLLHLLTDILQHSLKVIHQFCQGVPASIPFQHLEFRTMASTYFSASIGGTNLENTESMLGKKTLHCMFRRGLEIPLPPYLNVLQMGFT